jgi:hypothetical protein
VFLNSNFSHSNLSAGNQPNIPASEKTHMVPCVLQVFLGHSGGHDTDGNELPRLVYVSREKRPGFNHHKKAGAMNALVCI